MEIFIPTNNAAHKVAQAAINHDDVTLVQNSVHYQGKKVADYHTDDAGIHIEVTNKPWYVTEGMIRSRLEEVFA